MTSRVPQNGAAEYRRLVDAIEDAVPSCRGDWRYLADEHELDPGDIAEMKATCRRCVVVEMCAVYAATAKPPGGMWCGRFYPQRQSRRKEKQSA